MKVIYEKEIEAARIVVSPRPVWKCRTCPMYGKTPSCPPHAPPWKETLDWIRAFERAFIIKFEINMSNFEEEKRGVSTFLLKKEKEFFNEGFPFAFALFPGNCNICEECEFEKSGNCSDQTRPRPSIDAVGIEIGSFVKIDFNENVLYGLVMID
ncbi:MAG: metal-binding protein [Desulfuromonadales bacterium C00003093]|nr:MAG: metal-binding protein [Desulfuromonadales bacterium C00003093]